MKTSTGLVYLVGFLVTSALLPCFAQGSFQNLDFESANVPTLAAGQCGDPVSTALGLPGWTAYIGDLPTSQVLHNNQSLGAASVCVLGPCYSSGNLTILEGDYSVVLQPGASSAGLVSASIAQTGTIPPGIHGLHFKAWGSSTFTLTFAGQTLSCLPTSSGAGYTAYQADITAFAGQTGTLMFTAPFLYSGANNLTLDSITLAPEPGTWVLIVAGLALYYRRFRSQNR